MLRDAQQSHTHANYYKVHTAMLADSEKAQMPMGIGKHQPRLSDTRDTLSLIYMYIHSPDKADPRPQEPGRLRFLQPLP